MILAFIDRNYNLLFRRSTCIKIAFMRHRFKYKDIVKTASGYYLRCLGNGWYQKHNKK